MREKSRNYGLRCTRGNFLNVVPVYRSENGANYMFELYNNRVRASRPVAVLKASRGTVLVDGRVKRSFRAILEIRSDVPFSQEELNHLPTDVATLLMRELGGNPAQEEFIIKITCPIPTDSCDTRETVISESWMNGVINPDQYQIFSGSTLIMSG
ncbi:hypothetical protein Desor_1744 [Desulfosporosinus orientis DSM 765]|uniref:Uncharacterized protein n=2 Tax=Desulfosporosinus orientis TaxID=1563 RepID=G7W607_DESOD|nr:hypothetical protein Desor_1744 [Desulfosporosinus orientis DSM 765]